MRNLFSSTLMQLFVLNTIILTAQDERLLFSYDNSGRLIERKLEVLPQFRLSNITNAIDSAEQKPNHSLSIFPNPTNDYLTVEGKLPENTNRATITLLNSMGQKIFTDYYKGEKKVLPMSNIEKGIYFLVFNYTENENYTYKIIVSN